MKRKNLRHENTENKLISRKKTKEDSNVKPLKWVYEIPPSTRGKTNSVVHNTRPDNSFNDRVRYTQDPTSNRPCPCRMKEIVPLLVKYWKSEYHERKLRETIEHHMNQAKKQTRKIEVSI